MRKPIIKKFIKGIPYGQNQHNIEARREWSEEVKKQTRDKPKIQGPCEMRVTFVLSPQQFPNDHPDGPDLDNLLKRFQDALNETIFSECPGKDGCIVQLYADKEKGTSEEKLGARLEIFKV